MPVNNNKPGGLDSLAAMEAGLVVVKESLLQYPLDSVTPEFDKFLEQERINENLVDPSILGKDDLCRIQRSDGTMVELVVHGTQEVRDRIRKVLVKYSDIFSATLPSEPANLPAFTIEVDKRSWENPAKNRTAPRPQTWAKNEEIRRQLDNYLAEDIIEPSNAAFYSQVHLVPKPDGAWRFCIDYRNLNLVTQNITNWPLPYIRDMLHRIGQKKATIFGVMDFKSGYHQLGVDERCKHFLAFITAFGIYTFKRLPFGPKGAPSFFQMIMCTIVLIGLLYIICEVYLDDCIVHGKDITEFCENLSTVLSRFQKCGLTLNPKKCRFGMHTITYVGHTLDSTGITISRDKVAKVVQFAKPKTMKEMKSFLGLCNYLRDHIPSYAMLTHSLNAMVCSYKRSTLLTWNGTTNQAFDDLVTSINTAQKLFFYDPKYPVFLHTDASDYCMGANLFQIIDGIEIPIRFISKAFQAAQLRWKTLDKEGLQYIRLSKSSITC